MRTWVRGETCPRSRLHILTGVAAEGLVDQNLWQTQAYIDLKVSDEHKIKSPAGQASPLPVYSITVESRAFRRDVMPFKRCG